MYKDAYKSRKDLVKYSPNSLLLFSLIIKYGIEDIESIANEIITDGNDDKKADLVFVNNDEGYAVIAQSYESKDESKQSAPSNKASDLNTAVGWLLNREENDLPADIKSASIQLKNAINDNEIKEIEIWYVHNLPESQNVKDELMTVEQSAKSILSSKYSKSDPISVKCIEVGNETLNEWYRALETPILVNDKLEFHVKGGFVQSTEKWSSFSTAFKGEEIYNVFVEYGKDIFSANIRDYLGSRKSDSNINNNIKSTALNEPEQFFVYNNGITAITHDFNYSPDDEVVRVSGFSIVNGAQTTGSIGTLKDQSVNECRVPVRLIKCTDQGIIQNVVKYNNSQNKITATDFRSNDPIQDRLRKEFTAMGKIEYWGGRRGGIENVIRRPASLIPSDSVAQSLAAFHLMPNVAYNKKSEIWKSDKFYSTIFNEKTSARHIVFVHSLYQSIQDIKFAFKNKEETELIDTEKEILTFLRLRGASYMLVTAISSCLETITNKALPNKFRISFVENCSLQDAKSNWEPIVKALASLNSTLIEPTKSSLKNTEDVTKAQSNFRSLVDATKSINSQIYSEFTDKISAI